MPRCKFSDHTPAEWIDMWREYKRSVLIQMYENLTADLKAKYTPWGYSARQSQAQITAYIMEWEEQQMMLDRHNDSEKFRAVDCFRWLKQSGAIE